MEIVGVRFQESRPVTAFGALARTFMPLITPEIKPYDSNQFNEEIENIDIAIVQSLLLEPYICIFHLNSAPFSEIQST